MFFKVFFFKKKRGKEDFSKKFKKFRFFTWGLNRVLWRIATSVSACIRKRALLVCGLIVHAALFGSRMQASCQWRDAPVHPLMKCASPTQCCFGATRRWWCDLSHVGPWRTLAPSSIATVFSHNILAMILSHKEQSSFRLLGCHHLAKASNC